MRSKEGFDSSLIKTFVDSKPETGAGCQPYSQSSARGGGPSVMLGNSQSLSPVHSDSNKRGSIGSITSEKASPGSAHSEEFSPHSLFDSPSTTATTGLRPLTNSTQRSVSPAPSYYRTTRKEGRKKSTLLKESDMQSLNTLADGGITSLVQARGVSHAHEDDSRSSAMSTSHFVLSAQKRKDERLGNLLKPGRAWKEKGETNVRQYKPQKLWLPPIDDNDSNLVLKKPSKSALLHSFRRVMEDFMIKYVTWSNAEKGDFLLHVVDFCEAEEIRFLANCIYQRIEAISNISSLQDRLLIKIFHHLPVGDLGRAAQVNRRWRQLANSSDIWERNCRLLATSHEQGDVVKSLEATSVDLNWKQLYEELRDSIRYISALKAHNEKEEEERRMQQAAALTSSLGDASWLNVSGHRSSILNESQHITEPAVAEEKEEEAEEDHAVCSASSSLPLLVEKLSKNLQVSSLLSTNYLDKPQL